MSAALTDQYADYPKQMTHPQFRPATIGTSDDARKGIPGKIGTPMKFPPVQVFNEQQEGDAAKLGYVTTGKSDPEAWRRAISAPDSNVVEGQFAEFPKMIYSPQRTLSATVANEDEEKQLLARLAEQEAANARAEAEEAVRQPEYDDAPAPAVAALRRDMDELKENMALLLDSITKPAQPAQDTLATGGADAIRAALVARAEGLGVDVDGRWSLDRLLVEIGKAEQEPR